MYRFLAITLLGCLASAQTLTDVQKQCIAENSETLSNDFLLGTWYEMYRFALFGGMVPMSSCDEIRFYKPTAETIEEYKKKYNGPNLPYSLDDNPIVRNKTREEGMLMSDKIAKFYVLDPKDVTLLSGGFSVTAYRALSDKYVLWQDCAMRGNAYRLLSNDRYAPVAEMEELIKNTPEIARMQQQRYCATY